MAQKRSARPDDGATRRRRAALFGELSRLYAEASRVLAELAALDGATMGETSKPPATRPRRARALPVCDDGGPVDEESVARARKTLGRYPR